MVPQGLRAAIFLVALLCAASCSYLRFPFGKNYRAGAPEIKDYEPKGSVEEIFYPGTEGPSSRRMIVYLPAGYHRDTLRRYPVLYLLHGARGHEMAWNRNARVWSIIDSLSSRRYCAPMIVVTPNMNQYDSDSDMDGSRRKEVPEAITEIDGSLESDFCRDVVFRIDSLYRTIPDRRGRGIAGASIGGLQTMYIAASEPALFSVVGCFSPLWRINPRRGPRNDFYSGAEERLAPLFTGDEPPAFYLMEGRFDVLHPHIRLFRQMCEEKGWKYHYYNDNGYHGWAPWRRYLTYLLQDAFPYEEFN